MSLKISKLPEGIWEDCDNSDCHTDAIFVVENLSHGALAYACEDHREELIDFEMEVNP